MSSTLYIPATQSKEQIRWLYHSVGARAHLYYRLKAVIYSKIPNQGLPVRFWNYLERLCQANLDDETIYSHLFHYYHQERTPIRTNNRVSSRANEIVNLLDKHGFPPSSISYLDVGCNDGTITKELSLRLNVNLAHGCDVVDLFSTGDNQESTPVQFSLCTHDQLPYNDGQFNLVTALMSLHHMTHVEQIMQEINRVTESHAWLIVREHDLSDPLTGPLLDVVHGLYAQVWPEKRETETFCRDYFAHYRSRHEWRQMMERFGWTLQGDTDTYPWDHNPSYVRNPQRIVYQVYCRTR